MVAGLALVAFLSFTHRDPYLGLNAGFIGLGLNVVIVAAVSSLTKATRNGFD
jgi:solute:Na+ symporter, SSS family